MRLVRLVRLMASTGLVAVALVANGAHAELGGKAANIQTERARMNAGLQTAPHATHTIYGMTRPNGGSVKQFANAQGVVYAVTWSGPGKPDLRSLLGTHFGALQSASAGRTPRLRRQPVQVKQPDLVIGSGGHMGYFWGAAYIPSLAPADFSVDDLQ